MSKKKVNLKHKEFDQVFDEMKQLDPALYEVHADQIVQNRDRYLFVLLRIRDGKSVDRVRSNIIRCLLEEDADQPEDTHNLEYLDTLLLFDANSLEARLRLISHFESLLPNKAEDQIKAYLDLAGNIDSDSIGQLSGESRLRLADSFDDMSIEMDVSENREEATDALKKCVEIQPDFADLDKTSAEKLKNVFLDRFSNLAEWLAEGKQYEEAEQYSRDALDVDQTAEQWFLLAEIQRDFIKSETGILETQFIELATANCSNSRPKNLHQLHRHDTNSRMLVVAGLDEFLHYPKRSDDVVFESDEDENRFGAALVVYRKLIEAKTSYEASLKFKKTGEAYDGLGVILKQLGRLDEAVAAFENAEKLDRKNPLIYHQLGYLERILSGQENRKQLHKALENLEKSVELDGGFNDVHYEIGRVKMHLKDYEGAEKAFRQAIESGYSDPEIYVHLGLVKHILGKPEDAERLIERGIVAGANKRYFYEFLAKSIIVQRSKVSSTHKTALLRVADEMQSENLEPAWNDEVDNIRLANIYLNAHETGSAIRVLREVTTNHPLSANAWAHYAYALAVRSDGKKDIISSRDAYEKAMRIDTDNIAFDLGLGRIRMRQSYVEKGDKEQSTLRRSLRHFEDVIAKDPRMPWGYTGEAFVYRSRESNSLARNSFEKGIDAYLSRLNKDYFDFSQLTEVIDELSSKKPITPEKKAKIGQYYLALGKLGKSVRYLQEAVDEGGKNPDMMRLLADAQRMQYDVDCEKKAEQGYVESIKFYEIAEKKVKNKDELINLRNGRSYAQFGLALIAFNRIQDENALELIEKATKIYPEETIFYFLSGMIYDRARNHKKAEKEYKKANEVRINRVDLRDFVVKRDELYTPKQKRRQRALEFSKKRVFAVILGGTLSFVGQKVYNYFFVEDTIEKSQAEEEKKK